MAIHRNQARQGRKAVSNGLGPRTAQPGTQADTIRLEPEFEARRDRESVL